MRALARRAQALELVAEAHEVKQLDGLNEGRLAAHVAERDGKRDGAVAAAGRTLGEREVAVLAGPSADAIARGAKEKGMTAVHAFDDQNELVRALRADAKPGDALLFKGSRGMRMERALALFMGEEVE